MNLKAKIFIKYVPLYYKIRPDSCKISPTGITEDDHIIYKALHNNRTFIDNPTVHHNLFDLKIGKDADDCIKTYCL